MICSWHADTAHTQPAALGNGPAGTRRSAPPSLSCHCFLTLLLLLPVERSLLSPCSLWMWLWWMCLWLGAGTQQRVLEERQLLSSGWQHFP